MSNLINLKDDGEIVTEFLKSSKIKKGDLAEQMNMTRSKLNSLLNAPSWSPETIKTFLNAVNNLTADRHLLDNVRLFPLVIPQFLKEGKSIKNGIAGRVLKVALKEVFTNGISDHPFAKNLKVDASLGQGNAARSIWIGIRDNRISENGFSEGVYIVLLFDTTGQYAYLSIAYAVTDKKIEQLETMTDLQSKKIMRVIEGDSRYKNIRPGSISLGDTAGTTAEKYEKSVIVSKKIATSELAEESFRNDLEQFLSLFYDFVFEDYFENIEDKVNADQDIHEKDKVEKEKKAPRRNLIDSNRYQELLEAKAKHNKMIGDAAEEFVYNAEIQKLKASGNEQYIDLVQHVAKEKDGYGYDIESVEIDKYGNINKILLEVKGSSRGEEHFEFYLSERELTVAKEKMDDYRLALVEYVGYEGIREFKRVIPFPESAEEAIDVKPVQYKCRLKK